MNALEEASYEKGQRSSLPLGAGPPSERRPSPPAQGSTDKQSSMYHTNASPRGEEGKSYAGNKDEIHGTTGTFARV